MADRSGANAVSARRDAGAGGRQGDHHAANDRVSRCDEPDPDGSVPAGDGGRAVEALDPVRARVAVDHGVAGRNVFALLSTVDGRPPYLVHFLLLAGARRGRDGGGGAVTPREPAIDRGVVLSGGNSDWLHRLLSVPPDTQLSQLY